MSPPQWHVVIRGAFLAVMAATGAAVDAFARSARRQMSSLDRPRQQASPSARVLLQPVSAQTRRSMQLTPSEKTPCWIR